MTQLSRWALGLLLLAVLSSPSHAQSAWEVTPYQTRIWWVLGDQPDLPVAWRDEFATSLARSLQNAFGAAWRSGVEEAPQSLRFDLLKGLDVSAEAIFKADATTQKLDKLFVVAITGNREGYRLHVRELDCLVAHLGPVETGIADTLAEVTRNAARLITVAFSPIVRIDRTASGTVKTRLRAGSLIQDDGSPAVLKTGDILLPFDRRVSDSGATQLKNVQPIDWTYLLVGDEQAQGTIHNLEIISGFRQPFRAKRSRRLQQLALRARPKYDHSTIRLQSRSKTPEPLIGFEIHEKGTENTKFVGYTDWLGELKIEANRVPIRVLLVRSGDRVTAKLPIVPGLRKEVTASMFDNSQQVETDGFLSGLQIALVDLVARRESLTSRIQRRINESDFDTAETLIRQFRDLPTQVDFRREIQQQQQALNVTDPKLKKRIDTMFVETYRTLGKYLDPNRLRQLERQLASAQSK